MKKRVWPLEVQYMRDVEGGGGITVYFSRGHHDPGEFIREVHEEYDVMLDETDVVQRYMRWSMITGPDGPCQVGEEYTQPGRGRFPVTLVNV